MRKAIIFLSVILLTLALSAAHSSTANVQAKRCTLIIKNGSSRDFYRLHVSWNRDSAWGPNLLQTPLRPGMTADRVLVAADYDVLAVDAENNSCLVKGVRVFNDTTVVITNEHCQRRD